MCRQTFEALDRSWAAFTRNRDATAAMARWRSNPELEARDLDELVQLIWDANKGDADRMCAALARLAPTDSAAARVLLQVLRPGLRTLGRRLALGGSFDDVDHHLLALAWERIRTYPIERRPRAIAANILLDVRKRYVRDVVDPGREEPMLDELPPRLWPVAPSAEHEAIEGYVPSLERAHGQLDAAVRRQAITPTSASVIWRTRVQGHDDSEVAAELGVSRRTMQRRRQRAERELALAS